jgi:broad specificity phosphatase PhoE
LLVRHGEAEHNVRKRKGDPVRTRDPPLTPLGREQGERLRARLPLEAFPVAIVSPLTRTLQTARALGLGSADEAEVPRVMVSHWHAERNPQSSLSDTGSEPEALQQLFPEFEFGHLPREWWGTRETDHDWKTRRIEQFKSFLLHDVAVDNVLVVGHACFTRQLLHGSDHAPVLRNCEARYALLHPTLEVEVLHMLL